VRSPPAEEEGVAQMCDELTVTPIPHRRERGDGEEEEKWE